jgi:uncharacterized SAM-binding protein YcdF (DUF218 family)
VPEALPLISLAGTAVLLVAFIITWRRDKMRLLPGFLFDCSVAGLIGSYSLITMIFWSESLFAVLLMTGLVLLGLLFALFGLQILVVFFLVNASVVRRRESRTLANSLTLLCAIAIIGFLLVSYLLTNAQPPAWIQVIWAGIFVSLSFYLVHALVYLTSLILCCFARPKPCQDYVIVLGSGLVDGQVPRLLARRIDRAIAFGHWQQAKTEKVPILVMSGGQGSDEPCSEATAMAQYARDAGWDPAAILLEDRARNTLENMQFSKEIMDDHAAGRPYRCAFATSAYHLLRSGMFAKQVGMHIDGLAARSAWYFAPNAFLREYIAFLVMRKRRVIISFALLFVLGALLRLGSLLLMTYLTG